MAKKPDQVKKTDTKTTTPPTTAKSAPAPAGKTPTTNPNKK
jgi:hypothetical protein